MAVRLYRWVTFLLAGGYCLRMTLFTDYDGFGGAFRYLTIWALFASFFCASRMIAREEGRSLRRWDAAVSVTAVLNTMVVFLYWRLYFADPASVTGDGQLGDWWLEGYLHAFGPALQIVDALLIHRSFRRPLRAAACLAGVVTAYLLWAEVLVAPLNGAPQGAVTSGLPYPFLNDMEPAARLVFYAGNIGMALLLLGLFSGLAAGVRRLAPPPEAP